jgi:cell division protease FtsH
VKQPHKTLLIWVVLIVAFLAIWQFLVPASQPRKQRPFSEFIELVKAPKDKPHVESVEIRDGEYQFVIKRPGSQGASERGVTIGRGDSDMVLDLLLANDVRVEYQEDDTNPYLASTLTILLPMLFLLVMFYLFMRQLQAGGGKAMSFGKSRARLLNESQNKITFADVAGADEAKDDLE